jgi:hypothetical protein
MITCINQYRKHLASIVLVLMFFSIGTMQAQRMPSVNPVTVARFTALGALSWLAAKKSFETGCDYFVLKDAARRYRKEAYASDGSHLVRVAQINSLANVSGALSILSSIVAVKALLDAKNCFV